MGAALLRHGFVARAHMLPYAPRDAPARRKMPRAEKKVAPSPKSLFQIALEVAFTARIKTKEMAKADLAIKK